MKKRYQNRRGVSAVETALMLPLLVIVTFGSLDVAQYINTAQVVSNASREAGRVASRNTTTSNTEIRSNIVNYIASSVPGLSSEDASRYVSIDINQVVLANGNNEDKMIAIDDDNDLAGIDSGEPMSIKVSLPFSAVRWLPGISSYGDIETETICRRD